MSAHGIEVAQIVSRVRPAYQGAKYYIYNVLGYFQTKKRIKLENNAKNVW